MRINEREDRLGESWWGGGNRRGHGMKHLILEMAQQSLGESFNALYLRQISFRQLGAITKIHLAHRVICVFRLSSTKAFLYPQDPETPPKGVRCIST